MPNGTYGGVRGEKFIKNYPLLDCIKNSFVYQIFTLSLLELQ